MRTILTLLTGMVIGAAMMWGGLMMTGGWYRYRILNGPLSTWRDAVEHDGCEPMLVDDLLFGRCPRFRLP